MEAIIRRLAWQQYNINWCKAQYYLKRANHISDKCDNALKFQIYVALFNHYRNLTILFILYYGWKGTTEDLLKLLIAEQEYHVNHWEMMKKKWV